MRMPQVFWVGCVATLLAAQTSCAEPAVDVKATEAKPVEAKPANKATPADEPTIDLSAGIPADPIRPTEVRIRQALDEQTEVDFDATPIDEVIGSLKKKHGINIEFDYRALDDAGVGGRLPINCHFKDISLRSALQFMLEPLDMGLVIRNEALVITTKHKAEALLRIRVYPVRDLLDRASPGNLNPAGDLIAAITGTVAPTTWDEVGGPGSIKFLTVAESLFVNQTDAIHDEIHHLLAAARKARAVQPPPPKDQAAVANPNDLFLVVYSWDRSADAYRVAVETSAPDKKDAEPAVKEPFQAAPKALVLAKRPLTDELARVIPKVVDPASWQAGGGQGSIESVGVGLAVRQTRRVHSQVVSFLQSLEKAKKSQFRDGGGGGFFQITPQ